MDFDDEDFYIDEQFGALNESVYINKDIVPEELTQDGMPIRMEWRRPQEIASDPVLFSEKGAPRQMIKGLIDNTPLLAALQGVMLDSRNIIENLIIQDNETDWLDRGMFTVQLFKNGEWIHITVDTKIPTYRNNEKIIPAFGRTNDPDEFFVPLFVKIFAKLYGSFEYTKKCTLEEYYADLTGGISHKISVHAPAIESMIAEGELWSRLIRYNKWGYMLACICNEETESEEPVQTSGITHNYPYVITYVQEVGGLKMVQLYNTWFLHEWNGDWSKQSDKWDSFPEISQILIQNGRTVDRASNDGYFWMVYQDLLRAFNVLFVTRIFDSDFTQLLVHSEWKEKTASGKFNTFDPPGEDYLYKGMKHTNEDIDPQWCNNPQYILTCSQPADCIISLVQFDHHLHKESQPHQIYIIVVERKKRKFNRLWKLNESKIVAQSSTDSLQYNAPSREVSVSSVKILPTKSYNIIVCTDKPGVEISFTLRVFSREEVDIKPLETTYSVSVSGKWRHRNGEIDSAGGATVIPHKGNTLIYNPKWCQNPQFIITFPEGSKPTLLAMIQNSEAVARKESKNEQKIGLTIVPCTYEDRSVKRVVDLNSPTLSNVGNDDITHMSVYELGKRRVYASTDCKYIQNTSYAQSKLGSMLLKKLPNDIIKKGIIVIPSLSLPGYEGKYRILIHSDTPMDIAELSPKYNQTLAGAWVEHQAGGSHLHPKYNQENPKFKLTLFNTAQVTITLRRPHKAWTKEIAKDSVGCMIGFYVSTDKDFEKGTNTTPIHYEGRVWDQTDFVPMDEVSTPYSFMLEANSENEAYYIMPATFEPNKLGPFFVTVSSESQFILVKHRTH